MPIIFSQDNVAFYVGREALQMSSYLKTLSNLSEGAINFGKLCLDSKCLAFVFDFIRYKLLFIVIGELWNVIIRLYV